MKNYVISKKGKTKSIVKLTIILSLFILLLFFRNDIDSTLNQNYSTNTNLTCDVLDPINLLKKRIDNGHIELCTGKKSKHICYLNGNNSYNDIFPYKNGIICTMENIVLDPSKSKQSGISYIDGPIDFIHEGFPLLSKGFINAECNPKNILLDSNKIYQTYLNSWNYEYDSKKEKEKLEELAPGKTVFFISRIKILQIYFMDFQK